MVRTTTNVIPILTTVSLGCLVRGRRGLWEGLVMMTIGLVAWPLACTCTNNTCNSGGIVVKEIFGLLAHHGGGIFALNSF